MSDPTSSPSRPPFHADHVGSLLRPARLKAAREQVRAGTLAPAALRALEDDAIRRVVALQEDAGLALATDGELRRDYWYLDYMWQLGGIERVEAGNRLRFRTRDAKVEAPVPSFRVTGRLHSRHTIFGEDFAFLARTVRTGITPKLTIPSPSMLHFRGRAMGIDPAIYPDMDAYRADLGAVYAEQIERLGALGCRYLQLDDTSWGFAVDPALRPGLEAAKESSRSLLDCYADVVNAALARKPAGMTVCMHVCRGNFRSAWAAEGGYDDVAAVLFAKVNVDAFFLEYDDARSGSFAPLAMLPAGKRVVLGLVSSKTPVLEDQRALIARIEQAARHVPLERLGLSPQCGFASTLEGNALDEAAQMAKLRLVVATAREVWR